jgi:hypothetical protein
LHDLNEWVPLTGKRLDHFPRCQIVFNPCHADSMRDMIERWAHMLSPSPYSMITAHVSSETSDDNCSCRASLCASTSQCYIHIGATIWLGHAFRQGSCIHLGLPHLNVRGNWDLMVRNRPSSSTPIHNIELFRTRSK